MSLFYSQNHHNFFQRDTNSQATPQNSPSNGKINPAILFIIIILAVIFFISGLLHLIVRFLLKQRSTISSQSNDNNINNTNNYHDNLQQLFTLHDSGLDQAFIDALPVFLYKEIVQMSVNLAGKVTRVDDTHDPCSKPVSDIAGLKEPFDCAVCLCEFSECDKLRLLPLCSHAFHIDCIDTWLLSNSTCPLCRGSLYTPGIDVENTVFDFEDLRDDYDGNGSWKNDKPFRFPVRLGKFRSTSNCIDVVKEDSLVVKMSDVGETSSSNLDARRCYSMGSYQYVVDDSILQVALCDLCPNTSTMTATAKPCNGGLGGVELKRLNWMNEQSREPISTTTTFANASANVNVEDVEARKINAGSKKESLSVSKIWLWSKKSKFPNSSNADFSGGVTVDMSLPWRNRS